LEEQILRCISEVEGTLCDAAVVECLRKILDNVKVSSHASNALKLLAGLEADVLSVSYDHI
ncbi:hypothetical protein SK128_027088, partial [Halocaridina rubra]